MPVQPVFVKQIETQKNNIKCIPNNFNKHYYTTLKYLIVFGHSQDFVVKYFLYFGC